MMFKGVGTAVITPFNEDFSVDYLSLKKIIELQIAGGIDSLIMLGTSGEAPVLSFEEREKIIAFTVEIADKKVPVIVGTGSNNTVEVVKLNKQAEKLGADGLLIVNPYYNKGTQDSVIKHYEYICERTSLPVMLYNVPYRTGMNLTPATIVKIAEKCKNVVAVKEASSNISQIAELFAIAPEGFAVYSGNDDQALPVMAMGGAGVISVFSNAFPGRMAKLTTSFSEGNFEAARKYANNFNNMMNLMFIESSPAPVKYIMNLLGLCKNILRLPLDRVSESSEKILREAFNKFMETEN
jgi:4-hydroxy-tetrahydrodipicolinate synthase